MLSFQDFDNDPIRAWDAFAAGAIAARHTAAMACIIADKLLQERQARIDVDAVEEDE